MLSAVIERTVAETKVLNPEIPPPTRTDGKHLKFAFQVQGLSKKNEMR